MSLSQPDLSRITAINRYGYILLLSIFILIPFDRFVRVSVFSIVDVLLIAGLAGVVLQQFHRPIRFPRPVLIALLAFSSLAILRVPPLLASGGGVNAVKFLLTGIAVIILHLIMSQLLRDERRMNQAIRLMILSAVVINAGNILVGYGVNLPFSNIARGVRDIGGVKFPVVNRSSFLFLVFGEYGIWSTVGLSFALVSCVTPTVMERRTSVISVGIILYGSIIVLQSRNVWIGVMLAITIVNVCLFYRYKPQLRGLIIGTGVIGIFSMPIIIPLIFKWLTSVAPGTVESRIEQYSLAIGLLTSNPVTGVGRGTVANLTGNTLHSFYLQLALYNTFLSILVFMILIVVLIRYYGIAAFSSDSHLHAIGFLAACAGTLIILATFAGTSSYVPWLLFSLMSIFADNVG